LGGSQFISWLIRSIQKSKADALLIVLMSTLILIGSQPVQKQVLYSVTVSLTYQETYTITFASVSRETCITRAAYTTQEPHSVLVSYQEKTTITRAVTVHRDIRSYKSYDYDDRSFELSEQRLVYGSWRSSENLLLVLFCSRQTMDKLTEALVASGLAALVVLGATGSPESAWIAAAAKLVPDIVKAVVSSNDYSVINQNSDSFSRNWPPGTYYVLIVNISGKAGQFEAQITSPYAQVATVTRSRTETTYWLTTRYSDIISYRDVLKSCEEVVYTTKTKESEEILESTATEHPYAFLILLGLLGILVLLIRRERSPNRSDSSGISKSRRRRKTRQRRTIGG